MTLDNAFSSLGLSFHMCAVGLRNVVEELGSKVPSISEHLATH